VAPARQRVGEAAPRPLPLVGLRVMGAQGELPEHVVEEQPVVQVLAGEQLRVGAAEPAGDLRQVGGVEPSRGRCGRELQRSRVSSSTSAGWVSASARSTRPVTRPSSTSTLDPCTSPWTSAWRSPANSGSRSRTQSSTSSSRPGSWPGARRAASTSWRAAPTTGGWKACHGSPASASTSQGGRSSACTGTRWRARSAEPRPSMIERRAPASAVGHAACSVCPGRRSDTHHGPSGPSPWARTRAWGTSLPASRPSTWASYR